MPPSPTSRSGKGLSVGLGFFLGGGSPMVALYARNFVFPAD
jgi:hypothetical protein